MYTFYSHFPSDRKCVAKRAGYSKNPLVFALRNSFIQWGINETITKLSWKFEENRTGGRFYFFKQKKEHKKWNPLYGLRKFRCFIWKDKFASVYQSTLAWYGQVWCFCDESPKFHGRRNKFRGCPCTRVHQSRMTEQFTRAQMLLGGRVTVPWSRNFSDCSVSTCTSVKGVLCTARGCCGGTQHPLSVIGGLRGSTATSDLVNGPYSPKGKMAAAYPPVV